MSKEQRKRIDREIIAVHATTRMAQHVNKTFDNSFAQKKKYKNEFDPDRL